MTGPPLTLSDDAIQGEETKGEDSATKITITFPAKEDNGAPRIILLNKEIVAIEGSANVEAKITLTLDGDKWTFTKNDVTIDVTSVNSETF